MPSLRLFIAIEIPLEIRTQITAVISELKSVPADVRWERPEKLHITLKFLGDVQEEVLPEIVLLLRGVAEKRSQLSIRYSGVGCFPNKREPRIIWVGAEDVAGKLQPLVDSIETEMASIGFEKETKGFHPHVTIGRMKNGKDTSSLLRKMESVIFESQPAVVSAMSLVRSKLKASGSIYSQVKSFSFRG